MMPITATIDPILMIGPHEIETFAGAEVSRPCTFRPATLVRTDFPQAGHCTYRPAFSSPTIIRFPHVQLMRIAMAILINCTCGKRMMVGDEKAGRYVQCPACGKSVLTNVAGRKVQGRDTSAPAKVSISWGPIIKIGSIVAVIGIIAALYFGPYKVQQEFDAMTPAMRGNITDVITRGLEFASHSGMFEDPRAISHYTPSVHEITVIRPFLVMSLPQEIQFLGNSTEGDFKGKYDSRTNEVSA